MTKEEKSKLLFELIDKSNSVGLTPSEEERYCELNSELTGYPKHMFTKKFSDKLNDTISRTEELLKKLK